MKNKNVYKALMNSIVLGAIISIISSCDSRYTPRTVPDSTPPTITVRLNGEELNQTYTIQGMTITSTPPAITPTLNPGKTYRALIAANDTIGLYNLCVGLDKDFFEISEVTASPGTATISVMGQYTIIDVTLPISPAKMGILLTTLATRFTGHCHC